MSKEQIKYHFLYKTTNLINNKYYYGMHSTFNLKDGYLGSGKRLRYSINKYGKENFELVILDFYNSREDLINAEIELITEELLHNDSLCMNLRKGGKGGFISDEQQKHRSKCASEVLHYKLQNDGEFRDNWLLKRKEGVIKAKSEGRMITFGGKRKDWTGLSHTDESKKKIGEQNSISQKGEKNSQFGTCWITKDNENRKIKKEELINYTTDGWIKGRSKIN